MTSFLLYTLYSGMQIPRYALCISTGIAAVSSHIGDGPRAIDETVLVLGKKKSR